MACVKKLANLYEVGSSDGIKSLFSEQFNDKVTFLSELASLILQQFLDICQGRGRGIQDFS